MVLPPKLHAASTALVSLKIPTILYPSSYSLYVEGSGGLTFSENHTVNIGSKTLSILMQTDKAIYKPGQTVMFRVISLYPTLRPYSGEVNITITDSNGNKIAQWFKVTSSTGVIGKELKLADQTATGDWSIGVTALTNSFTKTFTVAEYVLPKYEVMTSMPSYFFVNMNKPSLQQDLTITVTAKYTYGEPVKGRASVFVQIKPWNGETGDFPSKSFDLELVKGAAQVTLTVDDLVALLPPPQPWSNPSDPRERLLYRYVQASSSVLETVTGTILKDDAEVQCVRERYKLEFLDITPNNYKTGLKFYGYLKLAQQDDSPPKSDDIKDATGQYRSVTVTVLNQTIQVTLTETGFMMFELTITSQEYYIYMLAQYEDTLAGATVTASKNLTPFRSRDQDNIQIVMAGTNTAIEPNTNVKFNVKTSKNVNVFSYQVLSKGTIVLTKSVVELKASTDHSFTLSITVALAQTLSPTMTVIVWFVNENDELVADSLKVPVNGTFTNQVSMTFNKDTVAPGDSVNLTVNANKGSYVGILAIDMSVTLLKTGNDITRDMVSSELSQYTDGNNGNFDVQPMWRWWWPCFVLGEDSTTLLENAGLFWFTDAYVYRSIGWGWEGDRWMMRVAGMPGAAAPAAGPSQSGGTTNMEPTRVRKNFPETWLWVNATASSKNSVTITALVPDTITSWVASAFALSVDSGLGITPTTSKLTVFQPFFISLNMPYAIIRGEEFALEVTIFNYMPTSLTVLVTLQKSNDYKVRPDSSAEPQYVDATATIEVPSNDAVTTSFWIFATSLGQILINVKAQCPIAADAVRQSLLVKPEGVTKRYSTGVLIQLPGDGTTYSSTLVVSLPPDGVLVPDSQYIECTVIGVLLGSAIQNLDGLLQMPYGCGEQNMLNFAPDVYILHYLMVSGLVTPKISATATSYMTDGYQRELTYQRSDGSFSAFGNNDPSGSTWLSAFVAKVFHQAKPYIPVDDNKISVTLLWLLKQQNSDGSFLEPGRVCHTDMQGGASKGIPLTAYVLIALNENRDNKVVSSTALNAGMSNATKFLEGQLSSLAGDSYALCIVTYALTIVGSNKASDALTMLMNLAINTGGSIHWEKSSESTTPNPNVWIPPYWQANSVDVEMTSYALLTYVQKGDVVKSLLIGKWLVSKQNANGGFSSTQDTVMGLEALASLASMVSAPSGSGLNVVCRAGDVQSNFLTVNKANSLLLQTFEVPSSVSSVEISASGGGNALVQLNVKYNVYEVQNDNGIQLTIDVKAKGDDVIVRLCGSWLRERESGMVVLEFSLLTGYAATNLDTLKTQTNGNLMLIENDKQKINLYFNEFTEKPMCFDIILEKVMAVNNIQRAAIVVYSYYDSKHAVTLLYEPPNCEVCPACCLPTDGPTQEQPTPEQPTPEQPTPEQPTPEQPTPEPSWLA
jgi:CD109 antigen